ncbi:MAG: hypothetical protein FWG63_09865 [Defluviitaleaceae bacterium]|nr:hypothetical protein [Defluviitaleaceae bacterium]
MYETTHCETEIEAIRLKLYEETKHMTPEEHTKWSNQRGQKLAAEFGFTIVPSTDMRGAERDRSGEK